MPVPDWLPDEIELAEFGGDWERYQEEIYRCFCDDFHGSALLFEGIRVSAKKHPEIEGKSGTFWHIVSSDGEDGDRIADLDRCKCILWPRAIIEHSDDPAVLKWRSDNHPGGPRTLLWLKDCDYLVVIAHRSNGSSQYCLLWTAYKIKYPHIRKKLQRQYDRSLAS